MVGDFNIRDSDWDPSYSYHLSYSDILNLDLSTPIDLVFTQYVDNPQDSN